MLCYASHLVTTCYACPEVRVVKRCLKIRPAAAENVVVFLSCVWAGSKFALRSTSSENLSKCEFQSTLKARHLARMMRENGPFKYIDTNTQPRASQYAFSVFLYESDAGCMDEIFFPVVTPHKRSYERESGMKLILEPRGKFDRVPIILKYCHLLSWT